jgi:aminotransferase
VQSSSRLALSQRSSRIAKADIRTMTVECERVGGINLAQGVCDMEVPLPVRGGAHSALERGVNAYTRHDGLAALRTAIADKMLRFNQIEANPETEVVVGAGSTGALYCACIALLDPGDEVVVFEPFYGYHLNTLCAVDAVPRYVRMAAGDWTFSREDLEKAVGSRTKAILINTPGNPTGKVYSAEELGWIAEVALKHDLFVFTDEIYEYFIYDGATHISPGAIPEIADRTITVSGYSKTLSITGWRIGYCVAKAKWAEMIGYVNDLVYVCAPSPLQLGVAEGIRGLGESYYRQLREDLARKRDIICDALQKAGFAFCRPRGAYYVLPDASHLPGATAWDKAMHLLNSTGVASVPGDAFFAQEGGERLLRFCYAKEDKELLEACERLGRLT